MSESPKMEGEETLLEKYSIMKNIPKKDIEELYEYCSLVDPLKSNDPLLPTNQTNFYNDTAEKERFIELYIKKCGTINPEGRLEQTPPKIKIELFPHQKRTVAEMIDREQYNYRLTSGNNILFLCDDVGSGKSIEILSLIAKSPEVEKSWSNVYSSSSIITGYQKKKYQIDGFDRQDNVIEFKSNLLIVPHTIYFQWVEYINKNTSLSCYTIDRTSKIKSIKTDMLKVLNENNIILVKSTMFKQFSKQLDDLFGETYTERRPNKNINNEIVTKDELNSQLSEIVFGLVDKFKYENIFTELKNIMTTGLSKLKNWSDNINYENLQKKQNLENSYYTNTIKSGYMFQRVFVDEVDTIKVPAFPYVYGKYTWFITSSIDNILYPKGKLDYIDGVYKKTIDGMKGSGFLKDTMIGLSQNHYNYSSCHSIRKYRAIVRNDINFIEDSKKIPSVIVKYTKCFTPKELIAISSAVSSDVLKALNAGDNDTAKKLLGASVFKEDDILKLVTKKLNTELTNHKLSLEKKEITLLEREAEFNNSKELYNQLKQNNPENKDELNLLKEIVETARTSKKSCETSISNLKSQIEDIQSKITGIEERVSGCKDKTCPICASKVNNPCLTPCCKNVFCLQCLAMCINTSKNKDCPFCRVKLDITKLNLIVDEVNDKKDISPEIIPPTKMEVLISFLKENPQKRTLVFSEFENSFIEIQSEFVKNNITFSKISGSSYRIANIINKFRNCEFQVLLLNASQFGAGLNLQFTDDIIIYHRMAWDLEKQVVGRAQRIGRTCALNINYLCFENEYPSSIKLE